MKINSIIVSKLYDGQKLRHFPVFLLAFAFLLRLGIILILKTYDSPYHFSEHVRIAANILAGNGYSFHWYGLGNAGEGSFMPPVYVAVILAANILWPTAPWFVVQIFQAILSACTAVIVYFIGRRIFSESVGMIAALLTAVYPPLLGYVLDIQSLTVETFLVTCIVCAYIYWQKLLSWKLGAVLGFVLGVGVLARSNLVLLLPFLLIGMILGHRRRGVIHFLVMFGVFALTLSPWTFRNYVIYQKFVLVSTNGGFTLLQGNNINAAGFSYASLGDLWKQYPELAQELVPLDEVGRDKRLYQESISFMETHPKEAFLLALKKFIYFWWFKPDFIKGGVISGYPWYFGLIYIGSYTILLCFSIFGLVLNLKRYKQLFIFYALFLVQTLTSMIFVSGTRYRGILEPLLIILGSYGMIYILSKLYRDIPRKGRKNIVMEKLL